MIHRAERAIIVAAGVGQRLRPVTLTTPKSLVPVQGVPLIDTVVHALHAQGIHEIYVVTGYLGEQFVPWAAQYPGVTLIPNPLYTTCNNISSLYAARAHLRNVIITDADLLIRTPAIFARDFVRSGYCCAYTRAETREWLLRTDAQGVVTHCSPTGGADGWQLFSVSFWSAEDGARLQEDVAHAFVTQGHTGVYWDDVALTLYPHHYQLGVRPIAPEDIQEIDTLDELCRIDPTYRHHQEGIVL